MEISILLPSTSIKISEHLLTNLISYIVLKNKVLT